MGLSGRVREWWQRTKNADIKREWEWAKPELLTDEELKRLKKFSRQSRSVKSAWAETRGREMAHAVFEELKALLPFAPSPELALELSNAWLKFIVMKHGLAWGLVATDDEIRMEVHAFYLLWMRTRGAEV